MVVVDGRERGSMQDGQLDHACTCSRLVEGRRARLHRVASTIEGRSYIHQSYATLAGGVRTWTDDGVVSLPAPWVWQRRRMPMRQRIRRSAFPRCQVDTWMTQAAVARRVSTSIFTELSDVELRSALTWRQCMTAFSVVMPLPCSARACQPCLGPHRSALTAQSATSWTAKQANPRKTQSNASNARYKAHRPISRARVTLAGESEGSDRAKYECKQRTISIANLAEVGAMAETSLEREGERDILRSVLQLGRADGSKFCNMLPPTC